MSPPLTWVEETGSTNDDARDLARAGAPHGTAVAARRQVAGRGRLGRTWVSPSGSAVLLSVVVRGRLTPARAPLLCLGAAVAAAEAAGPMYRIKWPNDVLAPDGRKVGGILAEAEWSAEGGLAWAILGIGLNVTAAPPLPGATCLQETDGEARDIAGLAAQIVAGVLQQADRVVTDPARVLEDWRRRNATLGRSVRVGHLEGTAIDIDPDGALRVRRADGREERVLAGDVEMIARR